MLTEYTLELQYITDRTCLVIPSQTKSGSSLESQSQQYFICTYVMSVQDHTDNKYFTYMYVACACEHSQYCPMDCQAWSKARCILGRACDLGLEAGHCMKQSLLKIRRLFLSHFLLSTHFPQSINVHWEQLCSTHLHAVQGNRLKFQNRINPKFLLGLQSGILCVRIED